ncbi:MAG: hypothetical protein KGZ58_06710 [Ignavibacteriales bacterium]|nr:hypothetical protein [Ignavibacteriales bacterium]
MTQTETHVQFEQQLMQLDESEQQQVFSFIQSLLREKQPNQKKNLRGLERLIGIGESDVNDGAAEHDHYVYGTPKKYSK